MALSRLRTAGSLFVLVSAPALFPACGEEPNYPGDGREPIGSVSSEVSKATRVARYKFIKAGAAAKGIPSRGYMLAGIAYHESAGLSQCQSELTWACKGPASPDCNGGPIMAGAGDGPCGNKQGGLGIFQFDAGTHAQTIAAYGKDVLTIEGATKDAVNFIVAMVKKSVYTTNAETDAKALAWINKFDPNNATLRDQWVKTTLRYYNGCQPTWSCWAPRYKEYNAGLSTVLADTGLAFWQPEEPPAPVDNAPKGTLEKVACDVISGWAHDPDQKTKSITTKVVFDGALGKGHEVPIVADDPRTDLEKTLGSKSHGFTLGSPFSLFDGKIHETRAYGLDANGTKHGELAKSPGKLTCPPKIPAGVARWVKSAASLKSWGFVPYFDQLPANKVDVDKIAEGTDLPAAPVLQQAEGAPEVYLVDGTFKRHVQSAAVLAAWRMSKDDVKTKTKAEIAALETAAPLRARPVLVADSAGRVLLIDDAQPGSGGAAGAGGTGAAGAPPTAGGAPAGGAPAAGGSPAQAGAGGSETEEGGAAGAPTGEAGGAGNKAGLAGAAGKGSAGKAGSPDDEEGPPVNVSDDGGSADGACAMVGPAKGTATSLVSLGALALTLGARGLRRRR